jgi:hypothetical protein
VVLALDPLVGLAVHREAVAVVGFIGAVGEHTPGEPRDQWRILAALRIGVGTREGPTK